VSQWYGDPGFAERINNSLVLSLFESFKASKYVFGVADSDFDTHCDQGRIQKEILGGKLFENDQNLTKMCTDRVLGSLNLILTIILTRGESRRKFRGVNFLKMTKTEQKYERIRFQGR
jgi:hypothetical protein